MVSAPPPILATNVGFDISFGVFVVALLTLFFLTARWAIRHDRAGFKAWRQRQQAAAAPTTPTVPTTPTAPTAPTTPPGEGEAPPSREA
jgi:hypothetical protein